MDGHVFESFKMLLWLRACAIQMSIIMLPCGMRFPSLPLLEGAGSCLPGRLVRKPLAPADLAVQAALRDMQIHCQAHGRSLAEFGLPLPADFDVKAHKQRELRAE